MATKWFYSAQSEAEEQLRNRFKQCLCQYQIVSKDRVINSFSCCNEPGEEKTQIEILLLRHGSNVSAFIYEMKYLQGWQTNK